MVIADPAKAVVTLPDAYLIGIGKVCVQWGKATVWPPGKSRLTKTRQHGHHQSQNASAEMAYNRSNGYVRPKVSERLRRSAGDRGLARKTRHVRVRGAPC
jgi:hypothetical protein